MEVTYGEKGIKSSKFSQIPVNYLQKGSSKTKFLI